MSFVSYAQNFEDVLLHRVFGGQGTGFYVDAGAYHPVDGSVTKAFYDRGWNGINVEPGSVFAELAQTRIRDVNLQMAVLDRAGEVAFNENEADRGTSYVDLNGNDKDARRMVPCDTLEAIVQAYSGRRPVDFIKIDVEGAEAAIICSTNWRSLRPRVLVIEATLPWSSALANQEWEPALLEQGYARVYFDGINCFYTPEEQVPVLQRHFQTPVNALDGVVTAQCEAFRLACYRRQEEAVRAVAERDDLRDQLARVVMDRDALQDRLESEQKESARATAERDALNSALQAQGVETSRLASEREALRGAIESERQVTEQLSTRLEAAHAEIARLTSEHEASLGDAKLRELAAPAANQNSVTAPGRSRRTIGRRLALAGYLLVRPVVRPLAWRTRSFLVGRLHDELHILMQTNCTTDGVMVREIRRLAEGLCTRDGIMTREIHRLTEGLHSRALDNSATAEMRGLAAEIERVLYSVAVERALGAWSHTDAASQATASLKAQ